MAIQQWPFAIADGATLYVVYDTVTKDIIEFKIDNPTGKGIRVTIIEFDGAEPNITEQLLGELEKVIEVTTGGKVVPGDDVGEWDLPAGMVVLVNTLPLIQV